MDAPAKLAVEEDDCPELACLAARYLYSAEGDVRWVTHMLIEHSCPQMDHLGPWTATMSRDQRGAADSVYTSRMLAIVRVWWIPV